MGKRCRQAQLIKTPILLREKSLLQLASTTVSRLEIQGGFVAGMSCC